MKKFKKYDVVIVGGAGHIGAPLSILLASKGLKTLIYDINIDAIKVLKKGELPFLEEGAQTLLKEALKNKMIGFSSLPSSLVGIENIILTIGTPIDEFHNPVTSLLTKCVESIIPYINDKACLILRSTVAPGCTEFLSRFLKIKGKNLDLAFCPERVVQGKAIEEIQSLAQIVSGTTKSAVYRARAIFEKIAPEIVEMSPSEAEYAKLICNAYRYITFAATNQLYMMVERAGINYSGLLKKMKIGYPRMGSIPSAGFAAGPCLMKDTMQLFSTSRHEFALGQIAMSINEGLPQFIVDRLGKEIDLTKTNVGILGMAFKAESDDIRDSLSFKLAKILRFSGAKVFCSDPYIQGVNFISQEEVVKRANVIFIGVPHQSYRNLKTKKDCKIIDLWGVAS